MNIKLKQPVLYRGRQYNPGEPIEADAETAAVWKKNGLIAGAKDTTENPDPSKPPAKPPKNRRKPANKRKPASKPKPPAKPEQPGENQGAGE
jgi:hypothetical protein